MLFVVKVDDSVHCHGTLPSSLQSSFSLYAFLADLADLEVDFYSLLLYVLIK